jgi:hypothetical protein
MGEVIFFSPKRNAERSERAAANPQGATILFFTGVRYQRHIEPVIVAPVAYEAPPKGGMDGAGGRRRRKRG